MSDNTESLKALELLNIETVHSNGEFKFNIEVTEEFESWFKEKEGLKKWSEKRFNDWFKGLITAGIPEVHRILLGDAIEAKTGKPVKEGL